MIEIIPAIDIIEGKCVRLEKGDYESQKTYDENPLDMAKKFEDAGLRRLHLVDLDGAKARKVINIGVLNQIASGTGLVVDYGGGIKTDEDIKRVFDHGAKMATIGSVAITDPCRLDTWIDMYGSDKIILGADVRDYKIAISGWIDTTDTDLFDFLIKKKYEGIRKVLCTDISKDGMLEGPAFSLYKSLMQILTDLYIIASGGISSLNDIEELENIGVHAVIIGKALYEKRIRLEDLKRFL